MGRSEEGMQCEGGCEMCSYATNIYLAISVAFPEDIQQQKVGEQNPHTCSTICTTHTYSRAIAEKRVQI